MIIHFTTFLLAGILLNLTPGNDTIFILTKSISQGKKAGIISALGIATGSVIHTMLAAFGLSIIIAQSGLAFNIIKYAGAVYLVYIGVKMITDRAGFQTDSSGIQKRVALNIIFRDAVVTNLLNPKVALFFISFLPQFIDPTQGNPVFGFLLLGTTFITTGLIWCICLAWFASAIFSKLRQNNRLTTWINRICGLTLVGLGIRVAFSGRE